MEEIRNEEVTEIKTVNGGSGNNSVVCTLLGGAIALLGVGGYKLFKKHKEKKLMEAIEITGFDDSLEEDE